MWPWLVQRNLLHQRKSSRLTMDSHYMGLVLGPKGSSPKTDAGEVPLQDCGKRPRAYKEAVHLIPILTR